MLTVQCTDVSLNVGAYLILKWSIQNTTDLRDAKKASFLFTFRQGGFFCFFLTLFGNCLWKVMETET